jgi:hypothetical protein
MGKATRGPSAMLQLFSIFLEFVIVFIALGVATRRKKWYGYAFAFTFAVYVFYDLALHYQINLPPEFRAGIFFAATVAALFAMLALLLKP